MDNFWLFLAALAVFYLAAKWLNNILVFASLRLRRVRMQAIQPEALDADERALIEAGCQTLLKNGFETLLWYRHDDVSVTTDHQHSAAVLFNAAECTYAEVRISNSPDAIMPWRVTLSTQYEGVMVESDNDTEVITTENVTLIDFDYHLCPDHEEFLKHHLGRLSQADSAYGARREIPADRYVTEGENWLQQQFIQMQDAGDLKPARHENQDVLKPTLRSVFKMRRDMIKSMTARHTLYHKSIGHDSDTTSQEDNNAASNDDDTQAMHVAPALPKQLIRSAEVNTLLNWLEGSQTSFNPWIKTALFLVSAVFFAALFGFAVDLRFVLIIVPILLFHELGHLLAMWAFGYSNLQVLFMPLGAVAIGKKDDPSITQEVIVYLAGPVPGILLAIALTWLYPDWISNPLLTITIVMLLFINILNLLPFPPLDGGQIIKAVLFNRSAVVPPADHGSHHAASVHCGGLVAERRYPRRHRRAAGRCVLRQLHAHEIRKATVKRSTLVRNQ